MSGQSVVYMLRSFHILEPGCPTTFNIRRASDRVGKVPVYMSERSVFLPWTKETAGAARATDGKMIACKAGSD